MSLSQLLHDAIDSGVHQIGQIRILTQPFRLHHIDDVLSDELEVHTDPDDAREIGLYTESGRYRFTKGELSLKKGWIFHLKSIDEVHQALDLFYPASLGIWRALNQDTLRIQHLREKLSRQTGMYRFTQNISTKGAQELVQKVCGPSNQCVKRILWKIDEQTPLEPSEASEFSGILEDCHTNEAIPLLCQEAWNYFVSETRKKVKEEFDASQS